MKITKAQLKQIIKEELDSTVQEGILQDLAMGFLKIVHPKAYELTALSRKYKFEYLLSGNEEILTDLLGKIPDGMLERALEKDPAAVRMALRQTVRGEITPNKFAMSLPGITKSQLKKLIKEELEEAAERTPEQQATVDFRGDVGNLTSKYYQVPVEKQVEILRATADELEKEIRGDF